MSINKAYVSSTQVASSTPFDNTQKEGYVGTDVQSALQEVRDYIIYDGQTTATTTNGTLTLVAPVAGGVASGSTTNTSLQFLTGSATGFSVELPNATTLSIGMHYKIDNLTSETVTIKDGSGADLFTLAQSSIGELTLQTNSTSAGSWVWWQTSINIAAGIISYNVVSSTAFSTTSTSDVVITGFTVTPQAGTYAIWVNGSWTPQAGPGNLETVTIYKAGTAISDSVRSQSPIQSLNPSLMSTQTITNVTGSEAIDVRIRSSSGQNLTVNQRSLLLIRLGT